MPTPRWDDEMKYELLRLKSELRPENFKALAPPLGLGQIRSERPPQIQFPHLAAQGASTPTPMQQRSEIPAAHTAQPPAVAQAVGRKHWLLKAVMAHALDLSFVLVTLGLGLVVLGFVMDPQNMTWDLSRLQNAAPLQFLKRLPGLALLLGIYTVFIVYWIFFKVITGTTLGETWLHLPNPVQPEIRARSHNGSADS